MKFRYEVISRKNKTYKSEFVISPKLYTTLAEFVYDHQEKLDYTIDEVMLLDYTLKDGFIVWLKNNEKSRNEWVNSDVYKKLKLQEHFSEDL